LQPTAPPIAKAATTKRRPMRDAFLGSPTAGWDGRQRCGKCALFKRFNAEE
jgi:hypothetical protein